MPDMVGGYTPFQVLANELEKAEKRSKKLDIGKVQKRAIQTTNSVYAAKDRWQGYVDEGYAEADMYANPQKYIDPNTSRRALANYATDAAASVDPRLLQSDRQLTPEEWLRVLMAAEAQAVEKRKRAEASPVAAFFGRFMDSLGGFVSQKEAKEVQQTYGAPTTGSAFADATADLAGQVATAYAQAQALAPVSNAIVTGLGKAAPAVKQAVEAIPKVGKYVAPAAERALTSAGRVALRNTTSAPEDRASGKQYAAAALMGAVDAAAEPMIGEGLTKLFPSISPYLERPLAAAGSSIVTALAAKPVSGQSWQEFKTELLPDIIADSLMSSIGLLNKEERAKAFEDRAVRMIYPAAIKAGKSKTDAEATRAGYVQALKNVRDFAEHPEAVTPDIFNALVDTQIKAREAVAQMDVPDKLKVSMVKYIDDSMETLRKGVGMPEPEAEPAQAAVPEAKEPEAPVPMGEELAEVYEPSDDEIAAGMAQMKVEGAQAEPVTPAVESAVASAVETTAATPESAAQATESAALAAVQKPIAAVAPLIPREEIAVGKKHTTTRKQPNGTFSVRTKTEVSLPTRTLAQDFPGDVDYDANRVVVTARGDDKTGRPPLQKDAVWGVYNERTKQWVAQSSMSYKDAVERAKDYVMQAVRPAAAEAEAEIAVTQAPAPAVPQVPTPIASVEPAAPPRPSLREELLALETKADKSPADNARLEQLRSLIRVDMSQRMPGMGVKLNVDGTVKPGWRIVETNPDTREVLVRDVGKQAEPDQWIPANKLIPDYKYNGAPPVKQTAPSTAGNAFDAVSRQLGDEVDAFIEEAQMPAGLSVQEVRGIGRPTQGQSVDPYSRIDPEAAERIKASHGVARQSTIEKFKDIYTRFNNQRTREFEHLPKTPFFEPMRFRLLTLQKQKGVASDKTLRAQEAIVLGLEGDAAKTFELKTMYDDLAYEAAQGRRLAFGYTPEKLAQDKASIDELVAANPTIQQSIDKRRKAWTAIRNDFKTWSKAVGQNVDGKFDNEDYFRHQVLEYANARYNGVGQVRRVRTPSGRSYMLKRAGSEMDFNTSYIQAEYEVMANMLHDIEVMKTIDGLNKDGYNVIQKLKKQAVADNKELMLQHFEQVVQSKDENAGSLPPEQLRAAAEKAYRGTLNWRQAQGYKELEHLAAVDSLPEGDNGEWKDVVDALTKAYNLRQADPENAQDTLNGAEMKRVWEYMGWLMKSIAPEAGEGKEAAGKVFRGQAYKNRYTSETLGDTARTWKDYIPEGYVAWDPKPGTTVYMTNTVSEQLAQKILESGLEGLNINADQLHKTAAFARQEPRYVIPQEIADTLDNMATYRPKNTIDEVVRTGMRGWKKWQLLNPRRAIKYNARNLSGDAHILAVGNPSAFKQAGRASKELYQVIFADRAMTPDMKDWFERGGMESNLMVQELGDVNKLKMFQKMVDDREARGLVPLTSKIWNTYWDKMSTATNYREGILRYAAYIDYLEQMKADPQGRPKNFGASDPERVMALKDPRDRAFKLSNELMGAYDQVSMTGQWLREHMIPFWSYQEVNLVRWKQLIKNAARNKELAATVGRSFKGVNGLNAAVRVGSLAIKALGFQAALQAYNYLLFRDEEEDLPEDVRDKAHIIFGRNSNGEVIYFDRLGALDDLAEWFGADEWPSIVRDLLNKRMTLPEAALAVATGVPKSIVNKVVGGVTPLVKTPVELIFKESTYPDAFNTAPIRDRGLYLAQQLELDDLYKEVRGMPSRGYLKSIANIAAYTSDPNESAYWSIYDKTIEYQKKIGKYRKGFSEDERSYALYYYKQALRYGDKKAAEKYLDLYVAKGGSTKGLKTSLASMTPLGRLAQKDRAGFLAWLTPEEQHLLAKANDYYNTAIADAPPGAKPANAVLGGSAKAMEEAEAAK